MTSSDYLFRSVLSNGLDVVLSLPVEMRDPDFTLRGKGSLKDVYANAPPGRYSCTFLLPGGAQFTLDMQISKNLGADIVSVATEALGRILKLAQSSDTAKAVSDLAAASIAQLTRPGSVGSEIAKLMRKGLGPNERGSQWRVKLFVGDPRGVAREDGVEIVHDFVVPLRLEPVSECRVVQMLQIGSPGQHVLVPSKTPVHIQLSGEPQKRLDIHFDHIDGDRLLTLWADGQFDQIAHSARYIENNEIAGLLDSNFGVGLAYCYAKMRSSDASGLGAVVKSSVVGIGSTDFHVIRGELEARHGRHGRAIDEFIAAANGELPYFTMGLNTLVDRLGFYNMATGRGAGNDKASSLAAVNSGPLKRLRRFASHSDQDSFVLSYSGMDPNRPSDEICTELN